MSKHLASRHLLDSVADEVTTSKDDIRQMLLWIEQADHLDPALIQKLTQKIIGLKAKARILNLLVSLEGLGHVVKMLKVRENLINDVIEKMPFTSNATKAKQLESVTKSIADSMESNVKVVGGDAGETNDDMIEALTKEMGSASATEFEDMTPESRERVRGALEAFLGGKVPSAKEEE